MTNEEFYEKEIEYVKRISNDDCAYVIIAKLLGKVDIDCNYFKECKYCYEACKTWLHQEHKEEEQERQDSVIEHLLKTYGNTTYVESGFHLNEYYITLTIHNVNKEDSIDPNHNGLLSPYQKTKIKLTLHEKCILETINKKYKWITRDEDDDLYIYTHQPIKKEIDWENSMTKASECCSLTIFNDLFNFIKWEDEEPYLIEDILRNCEVVENVD
jgi:hypothetical protein